MDASRIARWQLAGASVRQSQGLYWSSLLVDALVSCILGGIAAALLWPAYAAWALRVSFPDLEGMHGGIPGVALLVGIGVGFLIVTIAGFFGLHAISRIDVAVAVRESGLAHKTRHPVCIFLGVLIAAGVGAGYVGVSKQPTTISADTLNGLLAAYWGCALGLLIALALCESIVVPFVVSLVSHIIPSRHGLGAFLASQSARRHVGMSTAMVTPLCVAAGTVGAIMSMVAQIKNVAKAEGVPEEALQVTPAGQIVFEFLSPVILAAVAAYCVIVITGAQRRTDTALLMVAGVPRRSIVHSGLIEACIYSLASALLTYAILWVNAVAMGHALGAGPVPGADFAGVDPSGLYVIAAGFLLLAVLLMLSLASQTMRDPLPIVRTSGR